MDNNEIKRANRKAMPVFILVVLICAIIGGALGFFASKYGLNALTDDIKNTAAYFGMYIAPWLLLAVAVVFPGVYIPLYRKAKNLLTEWDGEDETVSDAADKILTTVIWLTSVTLVVSYFLISAAYSVGFSIFEDKKNILPFCIAIIAFLAVLVETVIIQQKCVDAAKKLNPEKTASVYDMKFQKKWMESCDEAEKIMIGKCAYKAYAATNTACAILALVLAFSALIFETSFLASFTICVIWIVNLSVYMKEARRYSVAGNKLT